MKTGLEFLKEKGFDMDVLPEVSFDELEAAGISPVVECCGCQMTLIIAGCFIDKSGLTWCKECKQMWDKL